MPTPALDLLPQLRADLAGRYDVERELGSGGMATVYLAHDCRYQREVAIKVLRPELAAAVGQRFLREIAIVARLNHPNILPLFDSGEAAGSLFYAMPFVAGESLRERLEREGPLAIPEAARIAREVADALAYAHAHGIVHRDIKPDNILLSTAHAIVSDFGVARAVTAAGGSAMTSAGLAVGTPAYMSPEQASAESNLDGRSDIYSLGCVLYEMLAGAPPFLAPTPLAVLARHQTDPVPPLRTVRRTVSPSIEQVILTALAKAPADRFATATDFQRALAAANDTATPLSVPAIARGPARRVAWAACILAVLAGIGVLWRLVLRGQSVLDAQRIVVYPLALGGPHAGTPFGEDASTALVAALNSTRFLKGLHGWRLLSDEQRSDPRPAPRTSDRLAREHGAGFFLDGRIVAGDSLRAVVELHDLAADSTLQVTLTFRADADAWTVGVGLARELLPVLLGRGDPIDLAALGSPSDAGAAAYLLGERAYRRGRFREAWEYFRSAVERDSTFALAAVMGAQAAGWGRLRTEAQVLLGAALRHESALAPRYLHYLRGLVAAWSGRADSAVAELRAALALDPEWPEAWAELGEVYAHWLPDEPAGDSLQRQAFELSYALDPGFMPPLYHLIENAVRRNHIATAEVLLGTFTAAGADSTDRIALDLMLRCVRDGPASLDWRRVVERHPVDVDDIGGALAVAGVPQPVCAQAALSAVLRHDTATGAPALARRSRSLAGLHDLLVARGRGAEAARLLEAETVLARPQIWSLRLLGSVVTGSPEAAAPVADSLRTLAAGDGPALWHVAVWEAHRGNAAAVRALAALAAGRAKRSGATRADSLIAQSVTAWSAMAEGDTAEAIRRLRALVPVGGALAWEALGTERLALARLQLATGDAAGALRTASLLDAPGAVRYIIYQPASLALRVRAERILRNEALATHYEHRLAVLEHGRSPDR